MELAILSTPSVHAGRLAIVGSIGDCVWIQVVDQGHAQLDQDGRGSMLVSSGAKEWGVE
ncbi:hypothetical protein [Streptomyces collinus]|uniref:hypothetical protein n=1 Tax=Streptomyces collinus TaxID=42684 RepID=UPI0033DE942D